MNRIYNLVFNRALGQLQVVSEFAHRSHGGTARGRRGRRVVAVLSALALGMAGLPATAQVAPTQLPTGGIPLGGIGSITADGAGNMTVTQIEERALILWNTFDVGEDATVTFDQVVGDIALNQIMDLDASQIFGNIEAAGTIFLINQNGIVFGETAQLNVGGLVASTLLTNTGDFLAQQGGEYVNNSFVFEQTGSPASIINRGNIVVTNGGHAILLGGHVLNDTSGLISAEAGRVDLLGGKGATLNLFPGSDFSIVVGDALDATVTGALAVVENRGRLEANGGAVYLHARLAAGVLDDAVNHSGTIDATGLGVQADGSVTLIGSGSAVRSTGDIDSGTVSMTGPNGLFLSGDIATSGDQDYVGAVTLVSDTTLSGGGAGNIQFGSTVDGGHALAVSAGGTVGFGGGVGQSQALGALSVSATSVMAPALNIFGNLSLTTTTTGGITQSGAFNVGGVATFDAGTGAITLNNAGNDFGGQVNLTGGTTTIWDANALELGMLQTGNLTAISQSSLILGAGDINGSLAASSNGGDINQNGALSVSGTTELDAGTGDVTLANAGNNFGGAVDVTGGAISLRDMNTLTVASLAHGANQAVALVAGGALNLSGTAIDTGTADLALQSGAMLTTAAALGGANVSLQGDGGIALGADVTATGDLSLTSQDAAIVQTGGALSVGGDTDVDAGTGNVTLAGANNDFIGAVNVIGASVAITDANALTLGTVTAGQLTATSTGRLDLGTTDVSGALVAHSNGGAIEQGGALQVGGTTELDAGTGNVTLANAGNDFGGAVDVTGGAISLRDVNALTVASLANGANQAVTLAAGGALNLAGAAISTGTADLALQSGALLTTTADLGGANVTLQGDGGIALGADVTATGDLSLTSQDAAIVQTGGALSVGGGTDVDAGTGNVTLANAGNDFVGAMDVTGGAISLRDVNALTVASLANGANQAVTLVAGGALNLDGAAIDTGTADLALQSGELLTTTAALGGANVTLQGDGGIALGADVTATGDLSLTSQDAAITQTGGMVSVGGSTDVDAGTGNVTLVGANNDFTGTVDITGGTVAIIDANALTLGTVTAGQLTATSTGALDLGSTDVTGALLAQSNGGAIVQGGALQVGGTTELDAGTGDVTLANAGNDFGGAVDVTGGAISLRDVNALTVASLANGANQAVMLVAGGGLNLGGAAIDTGTADLALQSGTLLATTADLRGANMTLQGGDGIALGGDVTTTGDLSLTSQDAAMVQSGGALSVGGDTDVDAGTGNVTLAGANNDFIGAVDIIGGSVTITDTNALTLGTVTAGQLTATSTGRLDLGTTDVSGALVAHSNGGDISQDGALLVAGTTALDAGTGDVTLANAGNDFGGAVDLTGGTISLRDVNALTVASLANGANQAVTLVAGGALNLAGAAIDTGTADLALQSGVMLTTVASLDGANVTLRGEGGIALGGDVTATGDLSLTSQDAAIVQAAGVLSVSGSTDVDAGTGDVTLANAGNDFVGAMDVTGGAVSLRDMNDLAVASLANGANQGVTLVAGGALNLAGAAISTGTADLALQSGSMLTTVASLDGANVTLRGDGGIALGADVTATGDLSLTSQDAAIMQTSGALHIGGTTELDAGTGDVTLANAGNDFAGAVDVTGGAISLRDMNDLAVASLANGANQAVTLVAGGALNLDGSPIDTGTADLALQSGTLLATTAALRGANMTLQGDDGIALGGDVTATGNLSLTSQDAAIMQTGGVLSVGGSTNVDAGTGDVTLANAGNDFADTVNLIGGTVAITDANVLTLGTVTAAQLTATSMGRLDLGATDVSGALVATSNGGAIEQDGALHVGGTTELDAGTGNVTLANAGNDFVGAVDITGGTVAITDATALTLGTVTAGQLTATSTGRLELGTTDVSGALMATSNDGVIEQSGALHIGGVTGLDAGTGNVTLANPGNDFVGAVNVTGDAISLRDMNDLVVASLANGANQAVTLVAGGALNLAGAAIDTGTADLALRSGAMLTTVASLDGANVTLRGDGGIALGADVTATGDLSLTSQDAAIAQAAGVLSVGGSTDVDAGTGDVTLANAGNDFVGAVDVTGGAVSLRDMNDLTMASLASGANQGVTLVAGAALNLDGSPIDTGTADLVLQSGALLATTAALRGANMTLQGDDGIALGGDVTAAGNLSLTSQDAAIVQTGGALSVGGTTELDAGTGNVMLSNADNDFVGAVDVTGGAISLRDMNDLAVASLASGANQGVTLVAGGALNLGGNAIDTGTADLALQSGGLLTTTADLGGANVALQGHDGIALGGDVTATGDLSLTSQDAAIVQTAGVLSVGGSADVDAGTGNVTLANAGNDFAGTVDITGGIVAITDANALMLGTVTADQLAATSTGRLELGTTDVSGALMATSNGGAIEQSGALHIGGTTELDAGTGNVTLANAGNDFVGTVNVTGGAISLRDTNDLVVTSLANGANQAVTLVAGGALNLDGSPIDTGTADLALQSGAMLTTVASLDGADVTLQGDDGIALGGDVTATGNLSLTSQDAAIMQTAGVLSVGGITDVDAGTGNVTLANAGNDFVGAVDVTGGTVAITDATALTLGTVTADQLAATSTGRLDLGTTDVSGALVATSNGGAIEQDGALHVGGTTELGAGTGNVTLANAGNDFVGAVDVTGGTVAITDANALTLGTVTAGQLTATSTGRLNLGTTDVSGAMVAHSNGGAIEQGGALHVGGTTELDAGTGDVTLANAGNDFVGAVNVTGGAISLRDANDLAVASLANGANQAVMLAAGGALNLNGSPIDTGTADLTLQSGTLLATTVALGGANVTLQGDDGVVLGGDVTASGDLSLTSQGAAIVQTGGALSIGGSTDVDAGTGDVTLANAGNDFVGAVDITGSTVAIRDANALTLGTVTAGQLTATSTGRLNLGTTDVSGALVATSNGGAIEQDGALLVGGTTELDAGTGDVTLTSARNDFGGAVDVTGGAISLRDMNDLAVASLGNGANQAVTLMAGGALNLGGDAIDTGNADLALQSGGLLTTTADLGGADVTLQGDDGIALGGDVTATGDLSLTSQDAAIVQAAGVLSVDGSTNVDAGTGDVTLANAGNDFAGAVDVAAGAISLRDMNDLTVASLASGANQAVTLAAGGALNLGGATIDTGAADLVLQSGTLLATTADLSGANVTLHGDDGIALGADVTATSDLSLTSHDAAIVQDTGLLSVSGITSANAGTGDVTLANAGNDFVGAVNISGGTVTITDANTLTLGTVTAGQLTATSTNALNVTGLVSGGDHAVLTATGGDILIDGAVSAQEVHLDASGAITAREGASIAAGTLSGRAGGATTLGSADHHVDNQVDVLGNFTSRSGFSMTNGRTLTLSSVDGSGFTVDAGIADTYLSVVGGDLLQQGTAWLYNGSGTFASTGHIGLQPAPIYVWGTHPQYVTQIGKPPAYFYAVSSDGAQLPIVGGSMVPEWAARAQNASYRTVALTDVDSDSPYRGYGIVDPGIRLPEHLRPECNPDLPGSECGERE
ncbi:two-partner secretion domain-containing protein [Lysobacter sp. A289]